MRDHVVMRRIGWKIAFVGVVLSALAPAAATASTVRTTIHITATVVDNLCNGEPVVVSGDLHITTTTTPAKNGGYTVRSTAVARDLRGTGLVSTVPYRGADGESSTQHFAPPPYPSTFSDKHWTQLVPQGPQPSMYLVIILKGTIDDGGSLVPVIERMYLTCHEPCPDDDD